MILTNQWRALARGVFVLVITGTLLAGNAHPSFALPDERHEQPQTLIGHGHRIVLIDAGHGGIDGGTSHGDILEKDLTLAISRKLFLLLRADGFDAVLNRFGDYAPSEENRWLQSRSRHMRDLAQRKELAETLPAAVVVSVHINWAPSPSKHGPIVLYRQEGRSFMLAKAIQDQLNVLYGVKLDSHPGKPFYLLNKITAPTVIVEAGFISSPVDRAMLTTSKGQEKIAEAVSNGIAAYLMEM
ncbi:N-acetylmuramoyl-L-alanine amidase [Paenibacillus sophorae]|uniref:N-acetylmuramoyl-L-alanine amidase n=1 Tax=Paenibacillus sophorae TaxID=1333845 RepID=A0A1H8VA48_9BACL|nr:N-acetylmuramoyl-L-alanine amidase [Paenibacillus sophorae]QWU13217.1 N-acetylmuramoyl-L-alanine amidase [Paenibacillus sophorae]SEP12342.1 N-acetylmuramoyl-L-alanine amidase [Paenibacillus sophorae]